MQAGESCCDFNVFLSIFFNLGVTVLMWLKKILRVLRGFFPFTSIFPCHYPKNLQNGIKKFPNINENLNNRISVGINGELEQKFIASLMRLSDQLENQLTEFAVLLHSLFQLSVAFGILGQTEQSLFVQIHPLKPQVAFRAILRRERKANGLHLTQIFVVFQDGRTKTNRGL